MKHKKATKPGLRHVLTVLLAVCLLLQCDLAVFAAPGKADDSAVVTVTETDADCVSVDPVIAGEPENTVEEADVPADTDMVRVSIVMSKPSPVSAGYSTANIARSSSAMAYRAELREEQMEMEKLISAKALDGAQLDVVWNLTLAANLISANVPYGSIGEIEELPGVSAVYIENRYDPASASAGAAQPNMLPSERMTGTGDAWNAGYSGAGSRIAIIDTGLDLDHQSFDANAFDYALLTMGAQAVKEKKFGSVDEYIKSLDLMDAAEINGVVRGLNAYDKFSGELTGEDLYINSKVPFGFNYVDAGLDVTHTGDTQGEHGSHVSGIAAANRYIRSGDSYVPAEETAHMMGQAPEAQLIVMKVFGAGGGAYESDYIAAIEDALMLGCDAVNLSLGSTNVGYTYSGNEYYDSVFASLAESDTVVSMSAGNNGGWAENVLSGAGLLYSDDVNNNRVGSPSSYTNSFSVASVDNNGFTGPTTTFNGGKDSLIINVKDAGNTPKGYQEWITLDTNGGEGSEYDYVFIGDPAPLLDPDYKEPEGGAKNNYFGAKEDYTIDVKDKVVLVARGNGINFADKQMNGAAEGAAAVVVYDNSDSNISMDISASTSNIPCVIISLTDARALYAATEEKDGVRGGTVTVSSSIDTVYGDKDAALTMSSFSSHGVPEALTMKPEITAPGGNIYSANGYHGASQDSEGNLTYAGGHDQYESMSGTSMAAPQVAGMSAVVLQYIRENGLEEKTGLSARELALSLLMSTAEPITEKATGLEYAVHRQGSGLANVGNAVSAQTYITMDGRSDGKVKAELYDDPDREGVYTFGFTVSNLTRFTQSYKLNTSILAPAVEEDGGISFMSGSMHRLAPQVSFEAAPAAFDLNGDGRLTDADVQTLLDTLAAGGTADADLSGDGKVDAYDAYLLMLCVRENSGAGTVADGVITVPANGKVSVIVTVTLTDADRQYIEGSFPNGTYVEGYIYLNAQPDLLGAVGVSHSIPMLAFYGSWSEGSMYERGNYVEDYYDPDPEPHYANPAKYANYMISQVNGSQYYYGLNMFAVDDEYLPERASISTALGSSIRSVNYTLIRNSAGGRVVVADSESGAVYSEKTVGQQYSAFYNTSGAAWANVSASASVGWKGTDAQGNLLPDGTRATVTLTTASEYYRRADGSIDWDAIDSGAKISMPVLIDNEAPEIFDAVMAQDVTTGQKVLRVSVQDNHYTAAIVMFNGAGSAVIGRLPINQTEEGVQTELNISIDGIIGTKFILMAADYAGNTRYYNVTIENNGSIGGFYAFNTANLGWVNFGMDVNADETVLTSTTASYEAGEFAEGYMFAVNESNDLYALDVNDFTSARKVRTLDNDYVDLAYDENAGTMYALRGGTNCSYLYTIDLMNGLERYKLTIDKTLVSLAWDCADGLYSIGSDGKLYHFGAADGECEEVCTASESTVASAQSTAFDNVNGILYWANGNKLMAIDVNGDTVTEKGQLSGSKTTCLTYYPSMGGEGLGGGDKVTGIGISGGDVTVLAGDTVQLKATVRPWFVKDPTVNWTSSNAAVATVDQTGLVTAVSEGEATITATSAMDKTKSVSTTITVTTLDLAINGVAMKDGTAELYTRSFKTGEITTKEISGLDSVAASTYDKKGGALWVMDTNAAIHKVDVETGAVTETVESASGLLVGDMEYSQVFGGFWSIYGSWIMVPTGFDTNSPGSGFDFSSYLAQYTGATAFSAIVSMGASSAQGHSGEQIILIDNAGCFWNVLVYQNGSSYGAMLSYGTTGLAGMVPSGSGHSAVFVPSYSTTGGIIISLNYGNISTVYAIDAGKTTDVLRLGSTTSGVAPLTLYGSAESTGAVDPDAVFAGTQMWESGLELSEIGPRG